MGLNLFGSSAGRAECNCPAPVDPNPKNFRVLQSHQRGRNIALMVNYPNCTNYEGDKILIYSNVNVEWAKSQTVIDPHFMKGTHMIARFRPDLWNVACEFVDNM